MAALRDKVSGMANWSLEDTSATGDAESIADGEWFVISTPNGECFRIETLANNYDGAIRMEHGPDWDSANSTWADRYAHDVAAETGTDDYDDPMGYAPDNKGGKNIQEGDSVSYYLDYSDSDGWVFYVDRNVGDGHDEDMAIGMARLAETWDIDAAANRESNYAVLWHAQCYDRDYDDRHPRNWTNFLSAMPGTQSGSTQHGRGQVNPDNNYANYTTTDNVVCSGQYKNNAGNDAIIGTHSMWVREESGDDASHEDTIQDDSANNLYKLCKAHNIAQVGIAME
ncbi:hypothetical protein IL252_13660 [Halomicrobium sp. IBSBa]|uniref:hypothetical protein n=1 Tax=Halomicrobium sp. IBSBa TaxID=2778916 RepID=UPI001ABF3A47|nr:hypothetical protein [Halomicrobium sp. IBSBa]MBO4248866.1 hypothetical protein [Halomicrobium sp. IBSBa]